MHNLISRTLEKPQTSTELAKLQLPATILEGALHQGSAQFADSHRQ